MNKSGISPFDGVEGFPIKTYDEKMEREVSNIIARCSQKQNDPSFGTIYIISDLSILTIEILEYISTLNKHE